MNMNRVEVDRLRNGDTSQGGMALPAGMERNGTSTRSEESGEELLPGIPNEITWKIVFSKLSLSDFALLSSINRTWQRVLHGRQLYEARVRSNSTETFVLINHFPSRTSRGTRADDIQTICLHSKRGKPIFELPLIPHLRGGFPTACQCVSLDGKVYILGGIQDPSSNHGSVEVYVLDLAGRQTQWKRCASMQVPRHSFGCGVLDGRIYVFGGDPVVNGVFFSKSEVYDPEFDAWFPIKPSPFMRCCDQVETVGKELFLFGGVVRNGLGPSQFSGTLEVYNPVLDQWRLSASGMGYEEAMFVANGKLHSIRKHTGIYVYEIHQHSWRLLHSWSHPFLGPDDIISGGRVVPTVAVAADDELLVRVFWWNRDHHRMTCLLQSRGLGSENKDLVWEEPEGFLPSRDLGHPGFLSPIQL